MTPAQMTLKKMTPATKPQTNPPAAQEKNPGKRSVERTYENPETEDETESIPER